MRLALLVLVVVGPAVGCSGGGGGGASAAQPTADVTGQWLGSWRSNQGSTGPLELLVTQTAADVDGNGNLGGSPCFSGTDVDGTVSGLAFIGTLEDTNTVIRFNARIDVDDENTMKGVYHTITAGSCTGDAGTIELARP